MHSITIGTIYCKIYIYVQTDDAMSHYNISVKRMTSLHVLTCILPSLLESDTAFEPFSAGTFSPIIYPQWGGAMFDVEHQEIEKIGKFQWSFHFAHIILILLQSIQLIKQCWGVIPSLESIYFPNVLVVVLHYLLVMMFISCRQKSPVAELFCSLKLFSL